MTYLKCTLLLTLLFFCASSAPLVAQCVDCPQWFIDQCRQAGYDVVITETECLCGDTPIMLNTSGKGIQLSSPADGVVFDLRADGHPKRFSWPEANSGTAFLILDRNGNGSIDNGKELFSAVAPQSGSRTPNGFLALAEFDKPENGGNGDGLIDAHDRVFSSLRLWLDNNRNGVSEPEELVPLSSVGIVSISLEYRSSEKRDRFGNVFRFRSKVESQGTETASSWAWDVYLRSEAEPSQLSELHPSLRAGFADSAANLRVVADREKHTWLENPYENTSFVDLFCDFRNCSLLGH